MEKINIICVDDQREVLSAVLKDLAPLADIFHIEDCEAFTPYKANRLCQI